MSKSDDALKTCFIISPIGEVGSPDRKNANFFRDGIVKPAFADFAEFGKPIRADDVSNPGMITDDIINKIFESDIVVADISTLNANVFYELGIRHAANRPTIHCAVKGTPIPFDNKGYSTIFYDPTDWESVEETRRRISESIRNIIAPDYKSSNPVTHALATKALLASADPKEKMLAEVISRIEKLENTKSERDRNSTAHHDSGKSLGDILGEALRSSQRREDEIFETLMEASAEMGRKLSAPDARFFAKHNSNPDKYMRFVNKIKRGEFSDLIDEAEIPF